MKQPSGTIRLKKQLNTRAGKSPENNKAMDLKSGFRCGQSGSKRARRHSAQKSGRTLGYAQWAPDYPEWND